MFERVERLRERGRESLHAFHALGSVHVRF